MKYTIAGIVVTDALILAWAWCSLDGTGFAFMIFALCCVTFFGSMPVVLGAWTRRKDEQRRQTPTTTIRRSSEPSPPGSGGLPSRDASVHTD